MSTSVVKDLVVLLDTGQQEDETFEVAKNVVNELLDTFTAADLVNVVTFDSTRATLLQPTSVLFSQLIILLLLLLLNRCSEILNSSALSLIY